MHDPMSQAAIRRIAEGDTSNEAICQLLHCILVCNQTNAERIMEILQSIDTLKRNYDNCPARFHETAEEPAERTHWTVLAKYGLWALLALLVIVAAALGVSLPFIN